MTSSYEDSFHKITSIAELPIGIPRVFRAAGVTVVIRRTEDKVLAIDGSAMPHGRELSTQWEELHARSGLAVEWKRGVWVCPRTDP